MDKSIGFAVIGCGMLARQTHLPHIASAPGLSLEVCCDVSEEGLAACAPFAPGRLTRDFRDAVADPRVDAIVLATTEAFRVPVVEEAARAGKPVYSEKPLADTLENARQIHRLVEQSGISFCVGHNRRCSPAMVEAQRIFSEHARNPRTNPWRFEREGWREMEVGPRPGAPLVSIRINDDWKSWKSVHLSSPLNREYGLVLTELTHFADLANWFIGGAAKSVCAAGEGVLNHAVNIHYENGGLAVIAACATGSFGYPKELLEAMGHAGVVSVDHMLEVRTAGIAGAPPVTQFPMLGDRHPGAGRQGGLHGWLEKKAAACAEAVEQGNPMLQFTAEPDKGHARMLGEFAREIRGERPPVCTVDSAIRAMEICLAAVRSIETGRSVKISEISGSDL